MKTAITCILALMSAICFGQDYFAVIKKDDQLTYNYPPTASFKLIDPRGNSRILGKDEAIDVTGDYRLEIVVPWKETPEIIESDGGRLEIFILPQDIREQYDKRMTESKKANGKILFNGKTYPSKEAFDAAMGEKPVALKKYVIESDDNPGTYELTIQFSNDLIFRYAEGSAKAWQNGKELEIKDSYLVETRQGLLKLSFDPKTGETWWVFEI